MRRLLAGAQFIQHVSVDGGLGIDEALEIEGVGHDGTSLPEIWYFIFWLPTSVEAENWLIDSDFE